MIQIHCRNVIAAIAVVLLSALIPCGKVSAQNAKPTVVTGKVIDATGETVIGAYVLEKGTSKGVITDLDGNYSITVSGPGAVLRVSCIGYAGMDIPVGGRTRIDITLQEESTMLDNVVVVGYGTQRKESVVGAITQVKGDALVESGSSNITTAIAGKLSGVMTIQTSGQPGQNDAEIIIRGVSSFNSNAPLVMVDGVERDFASIDPNEVAGISVLKDASATAVFGAKGANGVILVTTKQGVEGKPRMDISFSKGFSSAINTMNHVNAYETISLMNTAFKNDMKFEGIVSDSVLREYKNPSTRLNSLRYPDIDWMKELTNTFAPTTNANFNISGGSDKVKYFASVGYTHEGSLFKSMSDGYVDSSYRYDRINYRTNVDFKFTPTTTVKFNLGGNVGILNKPVIQGGDDAMWMYMSGSSTCKYPMYYPSWVLEEVPDANYPGATGDRLLSESDDAATRNPYYQLMRGYFTEQTSAKLFTDLIARQDLDFITKGLYVQAKVSLSTYYMYNTLSTDYNRGSWKLDFSKVGTGINPWTRTGDDGRYFVESPLYTTADNTLQGGYYMDLYYDASLNYDRRFGSHYVTGLFLFNRQEQDKGTEFPYYNEALVARASYDYAHKYLLEFNMGYTGSERFSPNNRFGFFPSGAVGWVVSEEPFFQPVKKVIHKLKFRYSDGLVGSDYAKNRWLYISEFSKDANGYIVEDKGANLYVQWEEARKRDLGIEMAFLGGDLGVNVDLFDEYRDKMLISVDNTTTMWVGNTSKELNKGAVKKHGFEVELKYDKNIGKDWTVRAGGNFSFNENRIVFADDAPFSLSHQKKIGTPIGAQTSGVYLSGDGFLSSVDDIHSNVIPGSVSDVVIGDYKFLDYTADGKIDTNDKARMIGSLYPPVAYAFNFGVKWKNLNLSALFQGYAGKYTTFDQTYEWEFFKGNWKTPLASLDYWSPSNVAGTHSAPHYSAGSLVNMTWSGYGESATGGGYGGKIMDASWRKSDYLRLKELSLSYTFSSPKMKEMMGLQAVSVYATANNLLTFTSLLEGDPECKTLIWGEYPQLKTIKLGLQLTF